jgi:hypothetical protein
VVDGLDINEATDGVIVYEPRRDLVHHLNATAAVVFTLCDGTQDADGIATLVAEAYGLEEPPRREVRACLLQLRTEGLIR